MLYVRRWFMRVLDTRKGEALRAADACCEKQSKQVVEDRVSERSVWESISSTKILPVTGVNTCVFYICYSKEV